MVKNGLQAIALNRASLWFQALESARARPARRPRAAAAHRPAREDSLDLLAWLEAHIAGLDARIAAAAAAHPGARLLLTHPGVGA